MSLIIILVLSCFFFDRISKILVITNMSVFDSFEVINNFFSITYARNFGAAFSFFRGGRYIFIMVAILVIVALFIFLKNNLKKINILDKICVSLILGGSLGNLLDRIIYGYVIDFLDFNIWGYNYPIFNFADSFIVVGTIILLINSIRNDVNVKNKSGRE